MQKLTAYLVPATPSQRICRILFLSSLLILTQASCNKESQEAERAALDQQKQAILLFAKSSGCGTNSECRYEPIGNKPCGGPTGYVIYSTSVDTLRLLNMISDYTEKESAFNRRWGLISDCSIPPPPDSVRCVNGVCVGYWNGNPKK